MVSTGDCERIVVRWKLKLHAAEADGLFHPLSVKYVSTVETGENNNELSVALELINSRPGKPPTLPNSSLRTFYELFTASLDVQS